jgi:alpha-glucoside transport system substrate-binding protein
MAVAGAATLALLVAGCGSGSGSGSGSGGTIQIWTSMDQPIIDGLSAKLDPEAKAKGITVKWTKVDNINQIIATKVQAGAAPDIAMIPQPGVIEQLKSHVTPLDNILDMNALKASYIPGVLDTATFDGKLYGLLVSANLKGLVFYPKKAWDAKGYKAPTTLAELDALTNQIKADGTTPWCAGIESGTATGWPATDWMENLVLRYGGIQTYNDWITHKVKFNSDIVKQAGQEMQKLLFTQGNAVGGPQAIATTSFQTAGNPLFNQRPGCMMYMQGSFITAFFPKSVQADLPGNVGVFGMPPVQAGGDNPVEGGGDTAALFKDTPNGRTVMNLLAATDLGTIAASNGSSFLSPHKDFPIADYKSPLTQDYANVAYKATAFGFDASDAMPGAVGAGTFWKQMTSWFAGQVDLNTALQNIDASWPS